MIDQFLMENVKPYGEFRIHSNKAGVRLYIRMRNQRFTGWHYDYAINYREQTYDPNTKMSSVHLYDNSLVGSTIQEALDKHLEAFPGDVQHFPIESKFTAV